ncbi:MAG: serine/threonine-protein kinase [Bradymonadia bacterium]
MSTRRTARPRTRGQPAERERPRRGSRRPAPATIKDPEAPLYTCRLCGHQTQIPEADQWLCPHDESVFVLADDLKAFPNDPLLGRRIGDQFLLVGRIGEGGFGVVYRAVQAPVGRVVAVKVLKESARRDPSGAARFFQEARAIGALRHPATVKLVSAGESPRSGGRPPWIYIAMEYIAGPTLKEIIQEEGPLRPERAVPIAAEVLDALGEAHRRGIVHRDLKPENIILEPNPPGEPRIRVVDFGISKVLKADDAIRVSSIHTRRGFIVGTTAYAAPERVLGHDAAPTSDLYSMGVMIFEMLAGELPFTGEKAQEVLRAHVEAPIPELPEQLSISTALRAEVRRALTKRPEGRLQTAELLAEALKGTLQSEGEASAQPKKALGGTMMDLPPISPPGKDAASPNMDHPTPQRPERSVLVGAQGPAKQVAVHGPQNGDRPVGSGPDTAPYMRPQRRGPQGTRLITQRQAKPQEQGLSWRVALLIGGLMGAIGAAISWGVARGDTPRYDAAPIQRLSGAHDAHSKPPDAHRSSADVGPRGLR